MEYSKIIKAANILFDSRCNLQKINELPEDCTPKNFKDAYLIQEYLSKIYLSFDSSFLIQKLKGYPGLGSASKVWKVSLYPP